jgi:hypothetical protein
MRQRSCWRLIEMCNPDELPHFHPTHVESKLHWLIRFSLRRLKPGLIPAQHAGGSGLNGTKASIQAPVLEPGATL